MNEETLIQKLIKIEALFAGATTAGERISANRARQRILERLRELLPKDPPIEYHFTFADVWSRKVFVALLRRYGLKPYRYHRQRYTTVMAQVPKRFVEDTLWPEFEKIDAELQLYLKQVTDRIVHRVLHEDSSEAAVVDKPLQIGMNRPQPAEKLPEISPIQPSSNPDSPAQPAPSQAPDHLRDKHAGGSKPGRGTERSKKKRKKKRRKRK